MPEQNIPKSTYRLQFNKSFTLQDAIKLIPYLHKLGISHIYASPLLKACPGSTHGYDVCDHSQINPEIGSEDDLAQLSNSLKELGMGIILDIVPNHMGVNSNENKLWWDVLEKGQGSNYADFFDIDWTSNIPDLKGKIILPALNQNINDEIANKTIAIKHINDQFVITYNQNTYPLNTESIANLMARTNNSGTDELLEQINNSPEQLKQILDQQHYCLVDYQFGAIHRNYQCFFDVSSLARLRVEIPKVFNESHKKLFEWYNKGYVDGFRIDHFDGLIDYESYLKRLSQNAPKAWIIAEKYFSFSSNLLSNLPLDGTVGCDFILSSENAIFSQSGKKHLDAIFANFAKTSLDIKTNLHTYKYPAL